jgi:hypothetical protein
MSEFDGLAYCTANLKSLLQFSDAARPVIVEEARILDI